MGVFSRHDNQHRPWEEEVGSESGAGSPGTPPILTLLLLAPKDRGPADRTLPWEVSLVGQSLGKAALSPQLDVVYFLPEKELHHREEPARGAGKRWWTQQDGATWPASC